MRIRAINSECVDDKCLFNLLNFFYTSGRTEQMRLENKFWQIINLNCIGWNLWYCLCMFYSKWKLAYNIILASIYFPLSGQKEVLQQCTKREKKKINVWFTDYAKAFDYVDHNKLWKILKEMGIPDHLTCLLRNLYAGQEATVTTGHGTTDWFQIGKGVRQGCISSPCLFNFYAEYIMRNAGLEEA